MGLSRQVWRITLPALIWALGTVAAWPQAAALALRDFDGICRPGADHAATSTAFRRAGWQPAPANLTKFFAQDLLEPDAENRFARVVGNDGMIFAAAVAEDIGTIGNRQNTLCYVRLFTEDPGDLRAAMRRIMRIRPTDEIEEATVKADLWSRPIRGEDTGFRAVQLPDRVWMVTAYRVTRNG